MGPVEGFIIFLDALGMKGIWRSYTFEQILSRWSNSVAAFMDSLQLHRSTLNANYHIRVLSDTIIIAIPIALTDGSIGQVFDLLVFTS